jgi:hypothetical protein
MLTTLLYTQRTPVMCEAAAPSSETGCFGHNHAHHSDTLVIW